MHTYMHIYRIKPEVILEFSHTGFISVIKKQGFLPVPQQFSAAH